MYLQMKSKVVYYLGFVFVFTVFYFMIIKSKLHRGRVAHTNAVDVVHNDIDQLGYRNKQFPQQTHKLEISTNREARLVVNIDEDIKTDTNKRVRKATGAFYKLRKTRINPFDFKFIQTGETICNNNEKPVLVMLCLTTFYDIETRAAIRETWGSVAANRIWPTRKVKLPLIKLVFLLGSPNDSIVKKAIIEDEHMRFGDIVSADFKDSYDNLTLKVMMGLKWVNEYCPHVKFVAKIDQDVFLHVANLLRFLHAVPVPAEGIVIGYLTTNGTVHRTGRWGVDKKNFPLATFPNYTYGHCYVISGNAVPQILEAAERMPYIGIEDAFITGKFSSICSQFVLLTSSTTILISVTTLECVHICAGR